MDASDFCDAIKADAKKLTYPSALPHAAVRFLRCLPQLFQR
jgi:hypothetical protein